MGRYQAIDQGVEINGRTILATIDGVRRFSEDHHRRVRAVLEANGIENPRRDGWYPQQAWLDAFAELARDLEPHLLDRIGEQIPEAADWPADVSGVEEGLQSIDEAYHRNHRGGEIGCYRLEEAVDRVATVVCENPYPCPFDRGIIRAVARQYAPIESFVFVEEVGEVCRRDGGSRCTYRVHW